MDLRNLLKKAQSLPLEQRKKILWAIVSIFAILFLFLFLRGIGERWEEIKSPSLPSLKEKLEEIPEEKKEELENLEKENSSSFEITPEIKEDLEKLLEDTLKALRESGEKK